MTKVIAEIGINHNGSLKRLFKLIDIAKIAGADYVKMQTYKPENVILKNIGFAPYQKKNKGGNKSLFELLKKYQISYENHFKIKNYCLKKKIDFISSPFDIQSAKFLCEKLKLKIIKIPSGEITNYPLLKYLSNFKGKIILSTGMSNIDEIKEAVKLVNVSKKKLILLHCNTAYPTPLNDANLLSMKYLEKIFKCKVGYSDHTLGSHCSIVATSLGASYLEKHITINNKDVGPDHKASLDKKDFIKFVKLIKNTKVILGSSKKKITNSEKVNLKFARRSIYTSKEIRKGEKFSEKNTLTLRPYQGTSPMKIKKIYGKKATKGYRKFELVKVK